MHSNLFHSKSFLVPQWKCVGVSIHLSGCGGLWLFKMFKCFFRFHKNRSSKQRTHSVGQLFSFECLPNFRPLLFDDWQKFERFLAIGPAAAMAGPLYTFEVTIYLWICSILCVVQCAPTHINCNWPAAADKNLLLFETIYFRYHRREQNAGNRYSKLSGRGKSNENNNECGNVAATATASVSPQL